MFCVVSESNFIQEYKVADIVWVMKEKVNKYSIDLSILNWREESSGWGKGKSAKPRNFPIFALHTLLASRGEWVGCSIGWKQVTDPREGGMENRKISDIWAVCELIYIFFHQYRLLEFPPLLLTAEHIGSI